MQGIFYLAVHLIVTLQTVLTNKFSKLRVCVTVNPAEDYDKAHV